MSLEVVCGMCFVDVVAQWLSQLTDSKLPHSSSGFDPGFPHSLLRGGRNKHDCVITTKSEDVRRPFQSKNKKRLFAENKTSSFFL
jgi:hypothetical protein